jgi:hypothetical protein
MSEANQVTSIEPVQRKWRGGKFARGDVALAARNPNLDFRIHS